MSRSFFVPLTSVVLNLCEEAQCCQILDFFAAKYKGIKILKIYHQ